ncbi:hypothetical protein C8R45DRAFT_1112453 [Mycena sanguinolenta]|nr:hypothetical protein C8R45DRAFT_1112453 [Mycena sanguinolenta]
MPHQLTTLEIRLNNITACLTPAVTMLNELNDAFAPPFIQPILKTMGSLINMIQKVKRNKTECTQLMENIHQVLYTIIHLHVNSGTLGCLPPAMTDHVGKFME